MAKKYRAMDEGITGEDLLSLPTEELEEFAWTLSANLEEIFEAMSRYTTSEAHNAVRRSEVLALEDRFKETGQVLKATVEAIISQAFIATTYENYWKNLAEAR